MPPPPLPSAPPNIVLAVPDDIPRAHGAYGAAQARRTLTRWLATASRSRARTRRRRCARRRASRCSPAACGEREPIVVHRPWNYVVNTFLTAPSRPWPRCRGAAQLHVRLRRYHLGFPLPQKRPGARAVRWRRARPEVRPDCGLRAPTALRVGVRRVGLEPADGAEPHHPEWMTAEAAGSSAARPRAAPPLLPLFCGTAPHRRSRCPARCSPTSRRRPPLRRASPVVAMRNETSPRSARRASSRRRRCSRAAPRARRREGRGLPRARAPPRRPLDAPGVARTQGAREVAIKKQTQQQRALARTFTSGLHGLTAASHAARRAARARRGRPDAGGVRCGSRPLLPRCAPHEAGARAAGRRRRRRRAPARGRRRDPGGAKVDATAVLLDIFPLLAAAGLGADEVAAAGGQGRSLLPRSPRVPPPPPAAPPRVRPSSRPACARVSATLEAFVVHDTVDRCKPWGVAMRAATFTRRRSRSASATSRRRRRRRTRFAGIKERGPPRARRVQHDVRRRRAPPPLLRPPPALPRRRDLLEQRNVADAHPEVYDSLPALILAHAAIRRGGEPVEAHAAAQPTPSTRAAEPRVVP